MKLHIENFRSIEQPTGEQPDMDIAPITVLYEQNGTGKSSALCAPLTMKNIVKSSSQEIRGFFNYGFTSLGQFSQAVSRAVFAGCFSVVIFDRNRNNEMELGITI